MMNNLNSVPEICQRLQKLRQHYRVQGREVRADIDRMEQKLSGAEKSNAKMKQELEMLKEKKAKLRDEAEAEQVRRHSYLLESCR